jgi:putative phosphotransacetylase
MVSEQLLRQMIQNELLCSLARQGKRYLPAAVSGRHVHLCEAHIRILFGSGYSFTKIKDLSQPGQYACEETVSIKGSKGTVHSVRILAPARKETQVEISVTDSYKLGITPMARMSGDTRGTPGCTIIGPAGQVDIEHGVIVSRRHLHISKEQGEAYGLKDGDVIGVRCKGDRGIVFENIAVRSGDGHDLEVHMDTDEANAAMLKNGELLEIV